MSSWAERVISYAGDLDIAAQEVIAELDEDDGVLLGTNDFRLLVMEKAKEHNVGKRDLMRRVKEYL